METVLICGGTGLIGQELRKFLIAKGFDVVILSRNKTGEFHDKWNPLESLFPKKYLTSVDHIINLSGESINQRWTTETRSRLRSSRIESTAFLYELLAQNEHSVKSFINASGISIYGDRGDLLLTEKDNPGVDFLANLCVDWEAEAENIRALGIRTNIVRISPVLTKEGGFLKLLIPIAKAGVLNPIGSGNQYFPWIHIADLNAIFHFLLVNKDCNDVWNACSPENVRQQEFNQALCKALKKPYFFPAVPAKLIQVLFGDRSHLFLDSICSRPENLLQKGFLFKFAGMDDALKNILSK